MCRLSKLGRSILLSIGLLFCFATPAYSLDVTLAWDANSESDLAGYKIYYDTDSGHPYEGTMAAEGTSPIIVPLSSLADPSNPQYTVRNLPAGKYYFAATAYDTEGLESGYSNEVSTPDIDTTPPTFSLSYTHSKGLPLNPSHVDTGTLTITTTFSEALSGPPRIYIDRPSGMSDLGPSSMSGSDNVWSYQVSIDEHDGVSVFDGINWLTISDAIDLAGNPAPPDSSYTFVTDTIDTDGDGTRDYEDTDDDDDGLPDMSDPEPLNPTGDGGYYGDYDKDGWPNWEEIAHGTDPTDPSSYPASEPPKVKKVNNKDQVIPRKNGKTASNDTCFAVLLESQNGIDVTDDSSVTLTINDGMSSYERHLNDKNAGGISIVQAVTLTSGADTVNELWVVYHRSLEDTESIWPFDASVEVQVMAKDVKGKTMPDPAVFSFIVESMEEHDERLARRPYFDVQTDDSGATTISNLDTGVQVTYTDDVPVQPYFDEEMPFSYLDAEAVPVSVHLGPHTFFPNGATVFIPCPGYDRITGSGLVVYGYDGEEWTPIIDSNGNDLTEGVWVIPEWNDGLSWQVHDYGSPSGVTIKVWHFSSFAAGTAPTSVMGSGVEEEGRGCFISSLTQ